jgi:SAM-dependent methyltransferase
MRPIDPDLFDKYDRTPDTQFYVYPRKVVHIDEGAIAAVTQLYRELLPAGGVILDLMSSWRSHVPPDMSFTRVAGLGMNAEEMGDNPQLNDATVQDLNADPQLPYEDAAFDACVCCVSVQYMQRPLEIFAEVHRVLRPGAPFVLTFSNRCFPTKAVVVWHQTDEAGRMALVRQYFDLSGGWRDVTEQDRSPRGSLFRRGDPLYAVWGYAAPPENA